MRIYEDSMADYADEKSFREVIKNYDFFAENEECFIRKTNIESVLSYGKHWSVDPQVTIIITTYKRPELLKEAIISALNQDGYNDYQILIADNEASDTYETPTSRMVKSFSDEKIIYYRHKKTVVYRLDCAAKYARSRWIVFMHDDDMLAPDYLCTMSKILKKHNKIKFLVGNVDSFLDYDLSANSLRKSENEKYYYIDKFFKSYLCTGYYVGWLGAIMDREAFIRIGGDCSIEIGMGDYCMFGKIMDRIGVYKLNIDKPLYYRRIWKEQETGGGSELWTKLYGHEYLYHRYVSRKYHPFMGKLWDRISFYRIVQKAIDLGNIYKGINVDVIKMALDTGVDDYILEKGKRYEKDIIFEMIYKRIVEAFYPSNKFKGMA